MAVLCNVTYVISYMRAGTAYVDMYFICIVPGLFPDILPALLSDLLPDLSPELLSDLLPELLPDLLPDRLPDLVLVAGFSWGVVKERI